MAILAKVRNSRTARDTAWALTNEGAALVSMTVSFLFLSRSLGSTGYGGYVGLYAMVSISASLAAGVTLAILDHIVRQTEPVEHVAATALGFVGSSLCLLTVVIGIVGSQIIDGISVFAIVALTVAELVLASLRLCFASILQAAVNYATAARLWLSNSLVRALVFAVLHFVGHLDLDTLAATLLAVGVVHTAIAHRYTQRRVGARLAPGRPRVRFLRTVGTYVVGLMASSFQKDADKIVLNASNHVTDAGLYGAAYRLIAMGGIPIESLSSATHVQFLDASSSPSAVRRKAALYSGLSVLYAAVFGLAVIVCAPLVPRVLGSDFEGTENMMKWLVALVALRGLVNFPMNGLLAFGKLSARTRIAVFNSIGTVTMYIILVPMYSWKGAVVATLISEVSMATVAWIVFSLQVRAAPRAAIAAEASR